MVYTSYVDYKHDAYKRTLHELGYPSEGYIVAVSTSLETRAASFTVTHSITLIRFADGRLAVIENNNMQVFTVNITQAISIAESFISPFSAHKFSINTANFTETYKDAVYYYVFTVYYKGDEVGYLYVNRQNGSVFFKNRLEELIKQLQKRGDES